MLCVSIGMRAAITISTASVSVGGTTYSGYGIYGAKAGELAQLLAGTYEGTVQWNGANLNQLKSAEYIKVGDSQNPNVLKDEDLEALELLSGAKFLDIDGSTLDDGADISNIKAGSAIEAVTLPNNLTKEQVNAAGAALTACNANFGSCLSLDAEMEERVITSYPYTLGGEDYEYTGDVSALTDNGDGTYTYNVTSVERTLTNAEGYPVVSYQNTDLNYMTFETSEGEVVDVDMGGWSQKQVKVSKFGVKVLGSEGSYYYVDPFTNENVNISTDDYSNIVSKDGLMYIIVDFGDNYKTYPYQNGKFKYQYTDLAGNTLYTDESTTPDADMKISLTCNENVVITPVTQTITAPVEGGNSTAIAYVNTPGSLYKATSLDANDAKEADALVISGNINNGDISQGGNSGNSDDPQGNNHDSDAYESNGAISAFNFNNTPAPIKSVDMSDAVIDDYKHLRVLNAYGANLESVVFPKTVTRIPNYCCYSLGNNGCQNLANVVFPTEASSLTIGAYAFHHTAITSLLIPGSVTLIGDNAFETCDKITDIEMEALSNTCHFGNYVFANCSALKHVTLSEKVENIGDYQFNQCGLLESIRIPSTCETIGSYSFYECFSIHQMTIPEGVKLIKINAFELAGITDLYIMANSIDKVPKIYAMSPTGEGPSTFTYQRTTGNNTAPQNHRDKMGEGSTVHYDEAMSWYQEEQSGPQGLGTGNCLTALHYPESMKPFYEAIDVTKFYTPEQLATIPLQTTQSGIQHYYTPDEYLALLPEGERRNYVQLELQNKKQDGTDPAYNFGVDEDGNPILYQYIPQAYAIDAFPTGHDNDRPIGPDADGRYYPNQHDYWIRMAAGATSTQAGGVGGEEVASAWGWRQFPLSSSVESIGETPFEKEYDDTWYTMAFPWRMIDNQLFSAFNQKMEIVEFVGAELLEDENSSTETVKAYNLVFHFDEVADTYYMDDNDVEYSRERDGDRLDAAGHRLWIYTSKVDGTVVRCPEEVTNGSYNPKNADPAVKEAYGKYLNIQNVMVIAGHPYMIHPSIGAAPGNPATVYINGVKKIAVGEGKQYASYEALALANKVTKTVSSKTRTKTEDAQGNITYEYSGPEAWTNPDTGASGGQYYFIGNINDEVKTVDETTGEVTNNDHGAQDMPLPSYFLGVINGQKYPKYYKKTSGGVGKWSQYSAIIRPDDTALANVESLYLNKVNSPTGGLAKGANIELGAWDFDESHIINEHAIATIIEEALEKDPATPVVHMNVVYNIKGQVVRNDSGSVEGLPKGIYIVNGKKYLVK